MVCSNVLPDAPLRRLRYSVLFTTNDAIRRLTATAAGYSTPENLPLGWQAISGGLAGMCAGAAMGPPELIKCRLQAANLTAGGKIGPVACVGAILREEGVKGMFRGTTSTMVREVLIRVGLTVW